jgi:hypothetical protein
VIRESRTRPLFGHSPGDKSEVPTDLETCREGEKKAPPDARSRGSGLELEAGLCPSDRRAGYAEIARPSSSTRTIGVPGFAMAASSRCAPPAAPSSAVAGGTEGSNPVLSTSESTANLTFSILMARKKSRFCGSGDMTTIVGGLCRPDMVSPRFPSMRSPASRPGVSAERRRGAPIPTGRCRCRKPPRTSSGALPHRHP